MEPISQSIVKAEKHPKVRQSVKMFQEQVLEPLGTEFETRRAPVRSSGIGLLSECPRKFMFRYRLGLVPLGDKTFALDTGTIYHWFMQELFLENGDFARAARRASEFLSRRRDEWASRADLTGVMPDGTLLDDTVKASERSFSLAQVMAEISRSKFFGPFLRDYEVLATEQAIEVQIKGITRPLRCKPDVLLLHKENQTLMIMDHKTTSYNTSWRAAVASFEEQVLLNRIVVAAQFPETPPTAFVHNIIRKPGLRYPAKKYPTWESYLEACREWYVVQETKDPKNPPLLQSLLALVGPVLSPEFYVRLTETSTACGCIPDPCRFYRNSHACLGRFGNQPCPYLRLCSKGMSAWADEIRTGYRQHFREDEEEENQETSE